MCTTDVKTMVLITILIEMMLKTNIIQMKEEKEEEGTEEEETERNIMNM